MIDISASKGIQQQQKQQPPANYKRPKLAVTPTTGDYLTHSDASMGIAD
jgi:hypothetical protein